ncbi:glycosyltransferase family 39 protein [Methylobacterium sp. JK268]
MRPATEPPTAERRSVVLGLTAILLARLAIGAAFLGRPALWDDETFSLFYAQKPLAALWGADWWVEPTPPLYYTLLHVWMAAAGASEVSGRCLSLLLSMAAVPVVFHLGAALDGRRTGLLAAFVFSLWPAVLEYALEIRSYSLTVLCTALALLTAARLLQDVARGAPPRLAGLLIACTLLAYCHATSLITLAALDLCLVGALVRLRPRDPAVLGLCLRMNLILALAVLPQIVATLVVVTTNPETLAWLPRPSPAFLALTFRELLLGQYSHGVGVSDAVAGALYLQAAAVALLLLRAASRLPRSLPLLALGVLTPAIGVLLLVIASTRQPILLPRTLLWTLIPLSVVAGAWLSRLRWAEVPRQVVACGAVALAVGLGTWNLSRREVKRPWQRMVATLASRAQEGDLFATLSTESHCLVESYAAGLIPPSQRLFVDLGPAQREGWEQRVDLSCNRGSRVGVADLERELASGAGVWLLAWRPGQSGDLATVLGRLAPGDVVSDRVEIPAGGVSLRLARPQPP